MKRLLKKLLVFALPFALLFALFFCFETYDYYALRRSPQYQTEPLSAMRLAMTKRPGKIILGDSRMANLDVDYIREITGGENYAKLAYGGAQLGESIDMFWYAAAYCELEQVIFGVNFHTSQGTQVGSENRYDPVTLAKPFARDVFRFSTNMSYWLKAMANAKQKILNPVYRAIGREDKVVVPEDPAHQAIIPPPEQGEKWRKNMEDYADMIQPALSEFDVRPETYDALQKVIDYCGENGIQLIFVLPPVHDVIYERVVEVNGMRDDLQEIKDFLTARATVYDLEIQSEFSADPDTFYDGFHLMLENKRLFARLLFTGTDERPEMIRRYIKNGVAVIPEHLETAYETA